MKNTQYTVEVPFSSVVRHKRVFIFVTAYESDAIAKAIHETRSQAGFHEIVVGDPTIIKEEPVEEIVWPTAPSS